MTRINTIDVKYLTDQHLRAEYLEYTMAIDLIRKSYYSRKLEGIPSEYKLGEGHVLFFKNKLGYLKRRHELIKTEMKKRNFKHDLVLDFDNLPEELFSDWFPSEKDILVNF
ncbi:MAG: pyrimidine dimer DNA glycosylase/endonuclease V, partial [Nanopusillaceae archaeon]